MVREGGVLNEIWGVSVVEVLGIEECIIFLFFGIGCLLCSMTSPSIPTDSETSNFQNLCQIYSQQPPNHKAQPLLCRIFVIPDEFLF